MILTEIKDYVRMRQCVSLTEVARYFDLSLSATQAMLTRWVEKKVLIEINTRCGMGKCASHCQPIPYYQST